jgi:hypothetical protein
VPETDPVWDWGMSQWYYAKDGQQHGPVPAEELIALLKSGEVDPNNDLVWNPSMPDWRPASQVPELSGAAPATAYGNQPFAYPTASGDFSDITPGSEPLIPTACVKRAFDLTVRHIGPILLIAVTYFGVSFGASFMLATLDQVMGWKPLPTLIMEQAGASPETIAAYGANSSKDLSLQGALISMVLTVFLMIGLSKIGLNLVSGKPFGVGMLFSGGKWLLKSLPTYLIFMVMFMAGLILLVVPGIIVFLRFGMYQNAIVDRNMGIIQSLGYSWELTKGNGLSLFVIFLFCILVFFAGCLAMIVGLLFAFPMMFLAWTVAYRWMQYGGRAVMDDPIGKQPLLAALPD